jgi:hypothetical protein
MFQSCENRSDILFIRGNKLFYKIVVLTFVCEFQKHKNYIRSVQELFKLFMVFVLFFRVLTYSRICDKFHLYVLTK